MRKISDGFTAAERSQLPAEFLANESAYFADREAVARQHEGLWIAYADGRVIASAPDLMELLDQIDDAPGHPFVALAGNEFVEFRIRSVSFSYDRSYAPYSLPRITVMFRGSSKARSATYNDAVPDTGADVSALPLPDCESLGLLAGRFIAGTSRGVLGSSVATRLYRATAEIGGRSARALVQPLPPNEDRIVGRDVLSRFRVTFDGPNQRIEFE
jgi:predicted aspartyl protease